MLNQILLPHAVVSGIGEQSAHHINLVIARPDAVLLVLLRIVLQDVGKAAAGKHLPPEIVGLDAIGIRRIARAVIHPLVERQKDRLLALQVRAEHSLAVVQSKMSKTATLGKKLLPRVSVILILTDGIMDGLLGETVLELKSRHRQPVHKQRNVKRKPSVGTAITKLTSNRKPIGIKKLRSLRIPQRRRRKIKLNVMLPMADPIPQHIHRPPLVNLTTNPSQQLPPSRAVVDEGWQSCCGLGLGGLEEGCKLC